MTWPGWDAPMVWGPAEVFCVVLAHAIVLGTAWVRWWGPGAAEEASCPTDDGG